MKCNFSYMNLCGLPGIQESIVQCDGEKGMEGCPFWHMAANLNLLRTLNERDGEILAEQRLRRLHE